MPDTPVPPSLGNTPPNSGSATSCGNTSNLSSPGPPPTLTTPPFPSTYPNLLTADVQLQAALDTAIIAGPGSPDWPVPVAIVALNDDGSRPFAQVRGSEPQYAASMLNVAAMLAAYELRQTIRLICLDLGCNTAQSTLLTTVAAYLNPLITAEIASIPPLSGYQPSSSIPDYATMFAVSPSTSTPGFTVDFTATFANSVDLMISKSDDTEAKNCINALGYGYINGVLKEAGLFDVNSNLGIWLGGNYTGSTGYRINTLNDGAGTPQGNAQVTTATDMARLFTLINDGAKLPAIDPSAPPVRALNDPDICTKMMDYLARGVSIDFMNAGKVSQFDVQQSKVGYSSLKPGNGGYRVDAAAEIVQYASSPPRRFVLVWLNLKAPYSAALGGPDYSSVGDVVSDALTRYVSPSPSPSNSSVSNPSTPPASH